MGLLVSILILLMLGLGIFQGWQLWYMRRELARMEQRLAESLDDQDLIEFQDRLKGLLAEAKEAGVSLVSTIERRQSLLEKLLDEVKDVEQKIELRKRLADRETKPEKPAQIAPAIKAPKPKPVKRAKITAPPKLVIAPSLPKATADPAQSAAVAPRGGGGGEKANRYQRVYELADQGLNREQIAKETSLLPGEIDLILNLRPGKRRNS